MIACSCLTFLHVNGLIFLTQAFQPSVSSQTLVEMGLPSASVHPSALMSPTIRTDCLTQPGYSTGLPQPYQEGNGVATQGFPASQPAAALPVGQAQQMTEVGCRSTFYHLHLKGLCRFLYTTFNNRMH